MDVPPWPGSVPPCPGAILGTLQGFVGTQNALGGTLKLVPRPARGHQGPLPPQHCPLPRLPQPLLLPSPAAAQLLGSRSLLPKAEKPSPGPARVPFLGLSGAATATPRPDTVTRCLQSSVLAEVTAACSSSVQSAWQQGCKGITGGFLSPAPFLGDHPLPLMTSPLLCCWRNSCPGDTPNLSHSLHL